MTLAMNDDIEQLIQRFLDGELTRSERRRLLELMSDHPEVRERLILDETMLDVAASLPRPEPGPGFVAAVAARLPAQEVADQAGAVPSRTASRWLAAAAAVVLLAAGFTAGRSFVPQPPQQMATASPAMPAVVVRMILMRPEAKSVVVVGDFNGWDPLRSPLQQDGNGLWGTTLTLSPGRYNYMFVVDGTTWVADPLAAEATSDGFGATNSVLDAAI